MTHQAPDRLFLDFQAAVAGRYSLERELGRGGMGVVYLAREVRLDRPVAIKLLPPSKTSDPGLRERFLREARTAAKLSHPNIIPIHAVEEIGGFVFFAMADIESERLTERVRRPALRSGQGDRCTRQAGHRARGATHQCCTAGPATSRSGDRSLSREGPGRSSGRTGRAGGAAQPRVGAASGAARRTARLRQACAAARW